MVREVPTTAITEVGVMEDTTGTAVGRGGERGGGGGGERESEYNCIGSEMVIR